MNVYVTQGEHFSVPGCPLSVHATEALANAEAAKLVNLMLDDTRAAGLKVPRHATADNWAHRLEWLQDYHGAAHCWVAVSGPLDVEGLRP